MITTKIAYGISLTDEFGRAHRSTESIVDLVNKHAIAASVAAGDQDKETASKARYDDYERLPWLVTQWSAGDMQLLVGVEAYMSEANTPQLQEKWLAVYQTVPEEIRQATEAAGKNQPEWDVLSGDI